MTDLETFKIKAEKDLNKGLILGWHYSAEFNDYTQFVEIVDKHGYATWYYFDEEGKHLRKPK